VRSEIIALLEEAGDDALVVVRDFLREVRDGAEVG